MAVRGRGAEGRSLGRCLPTAGCLLTTRPMGRAATDTTRAIRLSTSMNGSYSCLFSFFENSDNFQVYILQTIEQIANGVMMNSATKNDRTHRNWEESCKKKKHSIIFASRQLLKRVASFFATSFTNYQLFQRKLLHKLLIFRMVFAKITAILWKVMIYSANASLLIILQNVSRVIGPALQQMPLVSSHFASFVLLFRGSQLVVSLIQLLPQEKGKDLKYALALHCIL